MTSSATSRVMSRATCRGTRTRGEVEVVDDGRRDELRDEPCDVPRHPDVRLLTVKIRQPSHEFTFGVGMTFVSYSLVLTPLV
jgi:hypothetical protein